jgi:hypothetical protein
MRSGVWVSALLVLSSCVIEPLDLEGKGCPCQPPYLCNRATETCTRDSDRYFREVIADAPAAYYRFEETSGTLAADSSGSDRDGQYIGAVGLGAEGAVVGGSSVSLADGSYVVLGDEFDFVDHAPFTFELWIRVSDQLDDEVSLLAKLSTAGTFQGYTITVTDRPAPFSVALERWNADLPGRPVAMEILAPGEFHHVVIAYEAERGVIYLDGLQVVADVSHAAMMNTDISLRLGERFIGEIDELAIYDRVLSADRVEAHFDAR